MTDSQQRCELKKQIAEQEEVLSALCRVRRYLEKTGEDPLYIYSEIKNIEIQIAINYETLKYIR
jgi:hypothetical protein